MILTLNLKEIKYREVKKVGNNEKMQGKYICTKNQIITDKLTWETKLKSIV